MKAVIKFTNGFGQTEYWKEHGGWTRWIDDAQLMDVDHAISVVENTKKSGLAPSIWNTAKAVQVRLTEV